MAKRKTKKPVPQKKAVNPPRQSMKKAAAKSPAKKPIRKSIKVLRERKNLYNKIYRRRQKLEELKRFKGRKKISKDPKEVAKVNAQLRKVNAQVIHLKGNVREANKRIGVKAKAKPSREQVKAQSEAEVSKNFLLDPGSPYIVWEAWRHFDKQIDNPEWKWFIMNGRRISASNKAEIEFAAQDMWGDGDYQDYFEVSFNPSTKTIKYEKK